MKCFNEEYLKIAQENLEKCRETYALQTDYIKNSTAKYHGRVVKTLCVPKLFSAQQRERLKFIGEYTHNILVKTIRHYRESAAFRVKFRFEPRLEQLILRHPGISSPLPVARVDIFFNEQTGDFKFCEINTDGTSAMNEDRELNIALKKTYAFNKFSENHKTESFELFDSFVKEFMEIYGACERKRQNPNVAIVDFLDLGTTNEFEQFRLAFERAGVNAEICDIRSLIYKGGVLYSETGRRIDAVYRRAVTCDIMNNIDDIPDFISAAGDGRVCLIGPLSTQVAHSKVLFEVLSDEKNLTYLDFEEREFVKRHFPKTYRFTADNSLFDMDFVINNKDKWILKPVDSYGSRGVFAGVEGDFNLWKDRIKTALENDYVLQEFCLPYTTKNIDFSADLPCFEDYSNLTGLFLYNGKFKGVYSRVSKTSIISTQYSEIALATVTVD